MSGIYIPGVEMPEKGWHKVIKIFPDGTVVSCYDRVELGTAIPVPDHGRLIDADVLLQECQRDEAYGYLSAFEIDNAPTIIPADKEGEE